MTKHIMPYYLNICYRINLKLTVITGIGIPDANIYNALNCLHISARVTAAVIILPLLCMGKVQ